MIRLTKIKVSLLVLDDQRYVQSNIRNALYQARSHKSSNFVSTYQRNVALANTGASFFFPSRQHVVAHQRRWLLVADNCYCLNGLSDRLFVLILIRLPLNIFLYLAIAKWQTKRCRSPFQYSGVYHRIAQTLTIVIVGSPNP